MALSLYEAQTGLTKWLKADQSTQIVPSGKIDKSEAEVNLKDIIETGVPARWQRFSHFYSQLIGSYSDDLQLRAGHQLHKATSSLRAAFVWGKVIDYENFKNADSDSWVELDENYRRIKTVNDLPSPDILTSPNYPLAFEVPERTMVVSSMFALMSQLSLRFMLEQSSRHDTLLLPQPGLADETVLPWDNKL